MKTVFLDTVGLLAAWDRSDQWHDHAVGALSKIDASVRTVTTTFVMLECGNAAARRPYRSIASQMREQLQATGQLIIPTTHDWDFAWEAYRLGNSGDAGIVDCISFVVMRRLGITDAFTNDRHFKAAGFCTLF